KGLADRDRVDRGSRKRDRLGGSGERLHLRERPGQRRAHRLHRLDRDDEGTGRHEETRQLPGAGGEIQNPLAVINPELSHEPLDRLGGIRWPTDLVRPGRMLEAPRRLVDCSCSLAHSADRLASLRASARPVRISRTTRSAASAVMSAEPTAIGITSTTSAPRSSTREAISRTAQRRSPVVMPPGSGVPVPGAKAGSSTSMSTVRKTGPGPSPPSASSTTALIPRSRTSCMNKLRIPRSRCQENSFSPGQYPRRPIWTYRPGSTRRSSTSLYIGVP